MKSVSLPYVQSYERRGKPYHYFRKPGCRLVRLRGEPGSAEFLEAYTAALSGAPKRPVGPAPKPRTFNDLIIRYRKSGQHIGLAPITQRSYYWVQERIREEWGDKRVSHLRRSDVEKKLDKVAAERGRAAANNWLKHIRLLLEFAIKLGWFELNAAVGVKKLKIKNSGFETWPETLIEQFQEYWPVSSTARLCFDLALYTGQRKQDLAKMAWSNIRDGEIFVKQQKTGKRLWIPILEDLQRSLERAPKTGICILTTSYGKPFTVDGLGTRFAKWRESAGIGKGYSLHGLRYAAATRLAECGCTAHEIQAITGHRSLSEVQRYTEGADQRRNGRAAHSKLAKRNEQDENPSNAPGGLSKMRRK